MRKRSRFARRQRGRQFDSKSAAKAAKTRWDKFHAIASPSLSDEISRARKDRKGTIWRVIQTTNPSTGHQVTLTVRWSTNGRSDQWDVTDDHGRNHGTMGRTALANLISKLIQQALSV